jgi:hypothetical protein
MTVRHLALVGARPCRRRVTAIANVIVSAGRTGDAFSHNLDSNRTCRSERHRQWPLSIPDWSLFNFRAVPFDFGTVLFCIDRNE